MFQACRRPRRHAPSNYGSCSKQEERRRRRLANELEMMEDIGPAMLPGGRLLPEPSSDRLWRLPPLLSPQRGGLLKAQEELLTARPPPAVPLPLPVSPNTSRSPRARHSRQPFPPLHLDTPHRRNKAALEQIEEPFRHPEEPKPLPPTLLHERKEDMTHRRRVPLPPLKPQLQLERLAYLPAQAGRHGMSVLPDTPPLSPQQAVSVSGLMDALHQMERAKRQALRQYQSEQQHLEEDLSMVLHEADGVRRLPWMVPRLMTAQHQRSREATPAPSSPLPSIYMSQHHTGAGRSSTSVVTSSREEPLSSRPSRHVLADMPPDPHSCHPSLAQGSWTLLPASSAARSSAARSASALVATPRSTSASVAKDDPAASGRAAGRTGEEEEEEGGHSSTAVSGYAEEEFLHYWELLQDYDDDVLTDTLKKQRKRLPPLVPCPPGKVLSSSVSPRIRLHHSCCAITPEAEEQLQQEKARLSARTQSPHYQKMQRILSARRTTRKRRGMFHLEKQMFAWLHPEEMMSRANAMQWSRVKRSALVLRDVYGLPTAEMAKYQKLIFEEQEKRLEIEKEEIHTFRQCFWSRRTELDIDAAFAWVQAMI